MEDTKTAMQELIGKLQAKVHACSDKTAMDRRAKGVYVDCIMMAKDMFSAEKQQLEAFHMAGQRNAGIDPSYHAALAHYTETFKK